MDETLQNNQIAIPQTYWEDLSSSDLKQICDRSLASLHPPEGVCIRVLNRDILVDIQKHYLKHRHHTQWEIMTYPLLELILLVYLLNASPVSPSEDMVSVNELKDAHFFQGPHALPIFPIIKRYGNDPEGFRATAESVGGEPVEFADVAYRFYLFPKIPLYFLLWVGDEEFGPNLSVLFDRSIEQHFAADAILGAVNLVSNGLLTVS